MGRRSQSSREPGWGPWGLPVSSELLQLGRAWGLWSLGKGAEMAQEEEDQTPSHPSLPLVPIMTI